MPQEKVFVIAADHLVNGQRRHRLPHATNKTRAARRNLRLPWVGNALKPNQSLTVAGRGRRVEDVGDRVEVISEPSANETLTALAGPAWWLFSFRFGAATREATKETVKNYALLCLPFPPPLPPADKLSTHVKWKIHLTAAVRRRRTSSIKACKWA